EPVRLVAGSLQQPQCRTRAWQAQRRRAADKVDLLLALRQGTQGDAARARSLDRRGRRAELPLAAVDHRQVREWQPFFDPAPEVPTHDLRHRPEVVVPPIAPDLEAAVLRLLRFAVLEDDGA